MPLYTIFLRSEPAGYSPSFSRAAQIEDELASRGPSGRRAPIKRLRDCVTRGRRRTLGLSQSRLMTSGRFTHRDGPIGHAFDRLPINVGILSELPRGETRECQHCRWASFDRAVSSESLALAVDAVFYGFSIGLLLPNRATITWERHR